MIPAMFGELNLMHLENKEYTKEELKEINEHIQKKIKSTDSEFNSTTFYQNNVINQLNDAEAQIRHQNK
jgi:hypothetical protein